MLTLCLDLGFQWTWRAHHRSVWTAISTFALDAAIRGVDQNHCLPQRVQHDVVQPNVVQAERVLCGITDPCNQPYTHNV